MQEIQAKAGDRIEVIDVFVRDVQAPARVREAIEARLEREQQVAAERFQTDIIRERAQQAVEQAKGTAEAQRIISAGLTPAYLTFHYIEKLSTLPAGSVVYVPTEGGVPLMRNVGGEGAERRAPAGVRGRQRSRGPFPGKRRRRTPRPDE